MSQAKLQHAAVVHIVKLGAELVGLIGDVINISPALKRVMPSQPKRLAILLFPKAEQARWVGWEGRTQPHSPATSPVHTALGKAQHIHLDDWACGEDRRERPGMFPSKW